MTLTKETQKQMTELANQSQADFLDNKTGAFFRRIDWWAFWMTSLLALLLYTYTLAPTVTLEDSGELVVASDYLGVPHPPGYPIWTLITWFFQWVFHWVTYNGHPNPAWGVGFASAVSGAFACGLLALLISRSGADMLRSVPALAERLSFKMESTICFVGGVSGGMVLAFSPVLWSQSVIVEVYSLNALFQMAVLLLIYMWMCRPKNDILLFWVAFLFGLGLTNHQTLLFLGAALALAVLMKDAELFRDFVIAAMCIGCAFLLAAKGVELFVPEELTKLQGYDKEVWKWAGGPNTAAFWLYNYIFLGVPLALLVGKATAGRQPGVRVAAAFGMAIGLFALITWASWFFASEQVREKAFNWVLFNWLIPLEDPVVKYPFHPAFWAGKGIQASWVFYPLALIPLLLAFSRLPHARTVAVSILLAELGVAVYMYLPIASEQNPPMNWGYARTWEGFMHAVTRGQYEAISMANIFSERFLQQIGMYLTDLREQFSLPVAILGLLPFCTWGIRLGGRHRSAFPVAMTLTAWAIILIVFEATGWGGAEKYYRFAILLLLLIALAGVLVLVTLFLKKEWTRVRAARPSAQVLAALFTLGVLGLIFAMNDQALAAVRASVGIADPNAPGYLSDMARILYLAVVFLPPIGIAVAWALSLSPIKLDYDSGTSQQRWLLTSIVGFFSVSIIFLIFQNLDIDLQNLFIGRVQFIQSHALYALWLGYGLLLVIAWLARLFGSGLYYIALPLGLLLPPAVLAWQNAYSEAQIRVVGGAEQNGHHYGWQFGNWSLQGVDGIKEDFSYWFPKQEDFDREWGRYPTPDYPPPMTPNAVFYGGTDPGRFVPTYMIYSAHVRPDVYLITQNALADNTFMNVTRDLYGDTIYIPSVEDSNAAFEKYVKDVESGRIQAGADIKFENGRVSVQGVGGVMTINGLLADLIFKENKFRHDFYVEESYVIPWMYPYLTPHGLILKLNKEPLASLDPELVEKDHAFWDWYTAWLLSQSKFKRDICARKSFSKLRSAIAGVYEYRRMYDEAEYAFKQAVDLYPLSPEATFRLAQMYVNLQRMDDAYNLIEGFLEQDPNNNNAKGFFEQVKRFQHMFKRRAELEQKQAQTGALDLNETMELIGIYRAAGNHAGYMQLASRMLNEPAVPGPYILQLAQLFAADQYVDALIVALEQYLKRDSNNVGVWIDLAAAYLFVQREAEALQALRNAVQRNPLETRTTVGNDMRFQSLAGNREFRELFAQPLGAPALPGMDGGSGSTRGALPGLPGMIR